MHETQARRGVRRGAAVLLAMVLALSLGWQRTWADEGRQLIPVGKAVGIKLFADGVLVVSVSPVQGTEETRSPAKECGLKEGDILLTFNGEKIRSTEHLQAMLAENGETAAELTADRSAGAAGENGRYVPRPGPDGRENAGGDGQSSGLRGRRHPVGCVDPGQHGGCRHADLL